MSSIDFSSVDGHGINPSFDRRLLDRGWLTILGHRIASTSRELGYVLEILAGRISDLFERTFDDPAEEKRWQTDSKGLFVLVHGLNGHPAIWNHHIAHLKDEADLFVPYVPKGGNSPVEEAALPIFENIKRYTQQFPRRPVCLIGLSNGGRLCTTMETDLRKAAPDTPIRVSTIAAVHFGSSRMSLLAQVNRWTGINLGYHPSIIEELSYGSAKAREILDRVSAPLPKGVVRNYEFFATTEDSKVPDLNSTFPDIGPQFQATCHIVHGYDHNGIVKGVSKMQADSCKDWMRSALSSS